MTDCSWRPRERTTKKASFFVVVAITTAAIVALQLTKVRPLEGGVVVSRSSGQQITAAATTRGKSSSRRRRKGGRLTSFDALDCASKFTKRARGNARRGVNDGYMDEVVKSPSLITIGCMKCGTLAIRNILQHYPYGITTGRPEGHFFDKLWKEQARMTTGRWATEDSDQDSKGNASSVPSYTISDVLADDDTACKLRKEYFRKLFMRKKSRGPPTIRSLVRKYVTVLEQQQQPQDPQLLEKLQQKLQLLQALQRNRTIAENLVIFEKTPAYSRYPGIPTLIHRIFAVPTTTAAAVDIDDSNNDAVEEEYSPIDNLKFLAVLRNPIDRLHSDFRFTLGKNSSESMKLPWDFDKNIEADLQALRKVNLTRAVTLEEYRRSLPDAVRANDENSDEDMFGLFEGRTHEENVRCIEDLVRYNPIPKNPQSENFVYNSMYSLTMVEWLRYFKLNETLLVLDFGQVQRDLKGSVRTVLRFLGRPDDFLDDLPDEMFSQHYNLDTTTAWDYGKNPELQLSNETRGYLRKFYKPYNDQLADLLGMDWPRRWE